MWGFVLQSSFLFLTAIELEPSEVARLEELSYESSLREFTVFVDKEFKRERWSRTFSMPVIVPALGTLSSVWLGTRSSKTTCRKVVRRLTYSATGIGLGILMGYRLRNIWLLEPIDPEILWMLNQEESWSPEKLQARLGELILIHSTAIKRGYSDDVKIDIAYSTAEEFWSGIPARAFVNGRLLLSEVERDPQTLKLTRVRWHSSK